jgi:hypothetical protein
LIKNAPFFLISHEILLESIKFHVNEFEVLVVNRARSNLNSLNVNELENKLNGMKVKGK